MPSGSKKCRLRLEAQFLKRTFKYCRSVLYDEEDKIWYDYNHVTETKNRNFYPSNLSPLYTMSHHDDLDLNASVAKWSRLEAFNYSGGVPASLERSGEQWDFPNVWPPLVEMVVTALENVS